MSYNFHDNAAALIVAAAKKSGLLDKVAAALCFIDKVPNPTQTDCRACELLSDLADRFDHLIPVVDDTLRMFHGESLDMPQYSEEELRPHFHVPFEGHTATIPPRFNIDFDHVYDDTEAKAVIEANVAKLMQRLAERRARHSGAA
jgi:hypothetical protein